MSDSNPAEPKQSRTRGEPRDEKGRFLPGNSGFGGRPLGSRNKFSNQYIDDFYEVWQQEGKSALIRAARQSPARYIAVAAALIPQHFKVEQEHTIAGLSVEELRERLKEARARLIESGMGHLVIDADPVLTRPVVKSENDVSGVGQGLLRGQAKPRTEVRASPARRNRKTPR